MAFWSNWFADTTTNANPGDAQGVELVGDWTPTESRALPRPLPSPWAGWPAEWNVPNWDFGSRFNELIDVAWMCLDINSRVVSSMPAYRTVGGEVVGPASWMSNPDPTIYTGWSEFIKQYIWDYLLGEVFILPMTTFADDRPMTFRVIPPWVVDVEIRGGGRIYRMGPGGRDVSDEILHVRYKSTTADAHGVGPLANAGGRMLTAGVLMKYIRTVAETGGDAGQTLETDQDLTADDAKDIRDEWALARLAGLGLPPVLDRNIKLVDHQVMSPRDLAMLEVSQFTESRIAQLLGVPPFLAGLPVTGGSGDSMTYANVSQLFDYHDRSALRPYTNSLMEALSNWALPRGQAVELNRDEYSRPAFNERAEAWVKLKEAGLVTSEQFQAAERLLDTVAAQALTGATLDGSEV